MNNVQSDNVQINNASSVYRKYTMNKVYNANNISKKIKLLHRSLAPFNEKDIYINGQEV